jgi:hypothetical protein
MIVRMILSLSLTRLTVEGVSQIVNALGMAELPTYGFPYSFIGLLGAACYGQQKRTSYHRYERAE